MVLTTQLENAAPIAKLISMPASKIENPAAFQADTVDSAARTPGVPLLRIVVFVTTILSVLLSVNWFVCATWKLAWKLVWVSVLRFPVE